jgi:hypothetical protein
MMHSSGTNYQSKNYYHTANTNTKNPESYKQIKYQPTKEEMPTKYKNNK